MPGDFLLTGSVTQLIGLTVSDEQLAALAGAEIKFVSNVPDNKPVPVTGGVTFVAHRTAVVMSDGQLSENGTDAGIRLLANDPALELLTPLQWRILPGRMIVGGRTIRPASYWFNAPAPGDNLTLEDATPVPGVGQPGGTRGLRGYTPWFTQVDSTHWQAADPNGHVGPVMTIPVDTAASISAWVNARMSTPMEYFAIGDGTTNDTTALQNALADLPDGGELHLPRGKLFKNLGTLLVPINGALIGNGRQPGVGLIAAHANAVVKVSSYSNLINLRVDNNSVGNWGIQTNGVVAKADMTGVYVANAVQAGIVQEAAQNSVLIGCTTENCGNGFVFYNGCCNVEVHGCSDAASSAGGVAGMGGSSHRSILIDNSVDARTTGVVFAGSGGGNRDIRFVGGIYEYGTGIHTVDILNGSDFGGIYFTGTQLVGNSNTTSIVNVGAGYTGEVVFRDKSFGEVFGQVVTAAAGNVKFFNAHGLGSVGGRVRNLMALTTLSGTATATYGDGSGDLLNPSEMTFQTGKGTWASFGGATVTWNSTKRRMSLTSTDVPNGAAISFNSGFNNDYARQYGLIRLQFTIANATHNVRLSMQNTGTGIRTVGSYASGTYDVTYELTGDEFGFYWSADSAVSTTAEICQFHAEHVL